MRSIFPLSVYLVRADGVRAARPVLAYAADSRPLTLADVAAAAAAQFVRFTIEDADGVQVFASDARDDSGDDSPNEAECSRCERAAHWG